MGIFDKLTGKPATLNPKVGAGTLGHHRNCG